MVTLALDAETYSDVDLARSGVHAYAASPNFELLLLAFAFDDQDIEIIDFACGEEPPAALLEALRDPAVLKTAWNAAFEREILRRHFGFPFPAEHFQCTMVHALYLGLPGKLEHAARALALPEQKEQAGAGLINYFSKPCRPTKANGGRTRNLPHHDPSRWKAFKTYCKQDVAVERAIRNRLLAAPVPEREWRLWHLDQRINDAGIRLDTELVRQAIACDTAYRDRLLAEAEILTGLDNPASVPQLTRWIEDAEGIEVESLSKDSVSHAISHARHPTTRRVLQLRQQFAKTSTRKFDAMRRAVCPDGRVRGLLQFYGANRTGRWSARRIQPHNLPRNTLADLDAARSLVRSGRHRGMHLLYDSPPQVLSELVRTAFVPSDGHRFIIADFASIEARIVAWLAGEAWALDAFRSHGKIYEATAARMFGVPMECIDKGSEMRQKGKVATLACGYGGSVGALISMGALREGLTEDQLPGIVRDWRRANPKIVALWRTFEDAAHAAVREGRTFRLMYGIAFHLARGLLRVSLPAGRALHYVRPQIEPDPNYHHKDSLTYEGYDTGYRWTRQRTWGGKLVENVVQAIARDCLAEALLRLDQAGYPIAFHVHDEIIVDAPRGMGSPEEVCQIMSHPIPWAPGLPLAAEAFESEYYCKG